MNSEEQFSMILSEALDVLGYNREIVTARRTAFDHQSKVFTERMKNGNRPRGISEGYGMFIGSKGEGLTSFFESDVDIMFTNTRIQCSDDPASVTRDVDYVFEIDREGCPPGYTKLRLYYRKVNSFSEDIENSLIEYPDGNWYFSSTLFMSERMSKKYEFELPSFVLDSFINLPEAGPSTPRTYQCAFVGLSFDNVVAFPCQCTEYLQSWTNRPRAFDWPSRDQIENAATLDAHVVPVGAKGSEDAHLQWRICYTLPEVNLMQSLNETKWKLYVMLKMIRDLVFKPLGDLLTSYVLKNVTMWISESDPIEAFQPKYMLRKLRQCLDFINLGFVDKRISNYMISDRNLLDGRLDECNHREHLAALKEVRQNLPATILRCSKLQHSMVQVYTVPDIARAEMLELYREERSILHFLTLSFDVWNSYDNRILSCSTRADCIDVVYQILSEHPEIMAMALNVSVAEVADSIQILRMIRAETRREMSRAAKRH